MKLRILAILIIGLGLTCTGWTEDYNDLAVQGYRWVKVNGPFACVSEQDVLRVTADRTQRTGLLMMQEGRTYFLIPGTIAKVVKTDRATGMSVILLGGVSKRLWTYTKFLSRRPIRDMYGVVETPGGSGWTASGDFGTIPLPPPELKLEPTPSLRPTR